MKQLLRMVLFAGFTVPFMAAGETTGLTAEDAILAENSGQQEEAMRIYAALAEEGDTKSMISIALKYHTGDGVPQDYERAMEWYLEAFKLQDGDAFNNIGVMYRDGLGVEENKPIAYLLFLATHMAGLGTDATQHRAGRNLSRIAEDIGEDQMREALCSTWAFVDQYVTSRGNNTNIFANVRPSDETPRIKDNDWWLDHEKANLQYECKAPWD